MLLCLLHKAINNLSLTLNAVKLVAYIELAKLVKYVHLAI